MPSIGTPFDQIDAEKAHHYVDASVPSWLSENMKYAGANDDPDDDTPADHWQSGTGFLAPLPPKDDPTYAVLTDALKRIFVSEDIIGDVLQRRCNGVLGKVPSWRFRRAGEDDRQDDAQLDAINDAMRKWWKDKGVHSVLKQFLNGIGYAGRSFLRIYIPPGRFPATGEDTEGAIEISASSPDEALDHIFVEHVERTQGAMFIDRSSMREVGIVVFEADNDDEPIDNASTKEEDRRWAEITFHAGDGLTVIRIVGSQPRQGALDLGGRLIHYEGRHQLLVTDSVKRNQRDLNTTRTQIRMNNDNAAFMQRLFINLQPPGSVVTDGDGNEVFQVGTYNRGPGQDLFLVGVEETDENGVTTYKQGAVDTLEPIDNQNLQRSADAAREAIYRQCKQLHVAISGDATSSGEARVQAQGEYLLDLTDMKGVVDQAGRWLLETVWALAEFLAGATAASTDIEAAFECRINPGPLSDGMRTAILQYVEKGLISRETAMQMFGVDDPAGERKQIQHEAEEGIDPATRASTTAKNLQTAMELFAPEIGTDGNAVIPDEMRAWLAQRGVMDANGMLHA